MYTIKNYVMADSLEQAYQLKQKNKNNAIVGGNLWLRMGHRTIPNAIDLSALSLNQIEEDASGFLIGCMVTLRELETHEGLQAAYPFLFSNALKHIVGVQFRNCATVGGSVFPRFGFSDVLTAFLACDSYVDLYHGGRIPMHKFVKMNPDTDILTHLYVKKDNRKIVYQSFRMTETDFPTVTCAVSQKEGQYQTVVGARPKCAALIDSVLLRDLQSLEERKEYAQSVVSQLEYGSNMRGSAAYRQELSKILINRCLEQMMEELSW